MSPPEIQLLYDYNAWGNRRALVAAEKLTSEQFTRQMGSSFSSVRDSESNGSSMKCYCLLSSRD